MENQRVMATINYQSARIAAACIAANSIEKTPTPTNTWNPRQGWVFYHDALKAH